MNDEFEFLVTTYKGNEETILDLFNRNRRETQDRPYMDWRYLGETSPLPSVVFFVKSPNAKIIGMSALIFRAYWLAKKKVFFAVIGDISIDEKYRGLKLGSKLFRFKTDYIDNYLGAPAFVIGTPKTAEIFAKNGWESVEKIIEFVFLLNLSKKIYKKIHCRLFAKFLNAIYLIYINFILKYSSNEDLRLIDVNHFDSSFDSLWGQFDKAGMILRDRSSETLAWRYERHPNIKFKKTKVFHKNTLVGYIIYRLDSHNDLIIYDILFLEPRFIKTSLKLLLKKYWDHERINSIRIPLINENHSYCRTFKNSLFFLRKSDGVFQIYRPEHFKNKGNLKYFFTLGDKDI